MPLDFFQIHGSIAKILIFGPCRLFLFLGVLYRATSFQPLDDIKVKKSTKLYFSYLSPVIVICGHFHVIVIA